jgi:hypothetical protein
MNKTITRKLTEEELGDMCEILIGRVVVLTDKLEKQEIYLNAFKTILKNQQEEITFLQAQLELNNAEIDYLYQNKADQETVGKNS